MLNPEGIGDAQRDCQAGLGPVEYGCLVPGLYRTRPRHNAGGSLINVLRQDANLIEQIGTAGTDDSNGIGQSTQLRKGVRTERRQIRLYTGRIQADLRRGIAQRGQPIRHIGLHGRHRIPDSRHIIINVRDAPQNGITGRVHRGNGRIGRSQESKRDTRGIDHARVLDLHLGKIGTILIQKRANIGPEHT